MKALLLTSLIAFTPVTEEATCPPTEMIMQATIGEVFKACSRKNEFYVAFVDKLGITRKFKVLCFVEEQFEGVL